MQENLELAQFTPPLLGILILSHPFNDAATRFLVTEDVAEWVLYDYYYLIGVKVVVELLRRDQDGIQQLLDMGVVSLGLI